MTNIICCQPAICLATYVVFLKYVISHILVIKQIGISLAIGNTHHDCITVYTIDLSSKIVFDLLRSFVCNSFVYNPGYSGNVSPCDLKFVREILWEVTILSTLRWEVKWLTICVLEFARNWFRYFVRCSL